MLLSTKPPRCQQCRKRLDKPGMRIHEECVDAWIARQLVKQAAARKKKAEAAKKEERAQDRVQRESLKKFTKLRAEAQDAFNEFIRERDRDAGCFVCGKAFEFTAGSLGGVMDAGHVRSRGAAGHLRFNEDNCHGECKECNSSFGAKPHEIEAGAVRRIGQVRFDALKNDNRPEKWTRDDMRQVRDTYREKLKQLKAQREMA